MPRLPLIAATALALAGCAKPAPDNALASNITSMDENAADAGLANIVEIPADDGDAPTDNALVPIEKNTQ